MNGGAALFWYGAKKEQRVREEEVFMTSVASGRSVGVADLVSVAKGAIHPAEMAAVKRPPELRTSVTLHGEGFDFDRVLREITDRGGMITPAAKEVLRGFRGFSNGDVSGERILAFLDRKELDLSPGFSADLVMGIGTSEDYGFSPCAPETLIHVVGLVVSSTVPSAALMMQPGPQGYVFCCSNQRDHVSVFALEHRRLSSCPNLRFVFDVTKKFPLS